MGKINRVGRDRSRRNARIASVIEPLENRQLLTATVTTLAVPLGVTLGQNMTVTATVDDANGSPVQGGIVDLLNNGTATGLTAVVVNGTASFTFGAGNALFAGNYSLSAQFAGTTADDASTSVATSMVISLPTFTTTSDGLQMATVTTGSGAAAVTGQAITAEYTGFYQTSGAEFDESAAHDPGTFSYVLNASPEQVITGFDEGTAGIEIGETRVIVIPSALGYNDGQVRTFVIQSVAAGTVNYGTAAQVNVTGSPTTAATGQAITTPVSVNVEDGSGNTVFSDSSTVTAAIASGPAGGTLGGTTAVAASGGQASFGDLKFSQPGTYTLAITDGSLYSATTQSIVVAGAQSSLAPTLGKVSLPTTVVYGAKTSAKVPVSVTNQGNTSTGKVSVSLYADTGTSIDSGAVLVATSTIKKLTLKSGKTHVFSFGIKSLPASLTAGTYYLIAQVTDPSGSTTSVATSQTLTVANPVIVPGLTIAAVTPLTIPVGKIGTILITITNSGNVTASGFQISLGLSSDGITPVTGVTLTTAKSSAKIAAGKSKTIRLRFKATAALTVGTYFPYVTLLLGGVSDAGVGGSTFTITA